MEKTKTYHAEIAFLLTLVTSFTRAAKTSCFNNNLALPGSIDKNTARLTFTTHNFRFADVNAPIAKNIAEPDVSHAYANQER